MHMLLKTEDRTAGMENVGKVLHEHSVIAVTCRIAART